jgi:hypothetical protein
VKVIAAVLLSSFCLSVVSQAQTAPQPSAKQTTKQISTGSGKTKKEPTSVPANDKEANGKKLLEMAEADAATGEGGTRAYALLQIARAYQKNDKVKAATLLENALGSTRVMDDDKVHTRSRMQRDILNALVPLAPEKVDDLLTQVDPDARGDVLKSLLGFYEKDKKLDRAIEVLYRTAQEQEAPYDAVGRFMGALPAEQSGERLQLFATALNSYRDHDHTKGGLVFGNTSVPLDFPSLIVRYWKQVPPEMALEAIDEVLKQCEKASNGSTRPDGFSMTSGNGSLSFGSKYEYLLFQLLPVLKQLDPQRAESLLKAHQQLESVLAAHPDGVSSLFTSPAKQGYARPTGSSGGSFVVRSGGNDEASARNVARFQELERAKQIAKDSGAHPQEAMAQIAGIEDTEARAIALDGIAQANVTSNPSVSKSALKELLDVATKLDGYRQVRFLNSCARLYLQMDEIEDAKKAIEKGLLGAEKIYKQDSNADDPNKALKVYWPSTQVYAGLLNGAARVSPIWAASLLDQMPDAEVRTVAEVSLASALLNVAGGTVTVMTQTKHSANMSMFVLD